MLINKSKRNWRNKYVACELVFRSIGYRGIKFKGVPFDDNKGVIPNIEGKVISKENEPVDKLYVTGWIKKAPPV